MDHGENGYLEQRIVRALFECRSILSVGSMRGKFMDKIRCKRKIALDAYKPYLDEIPFQCEKLHGYANDILPTLADESIDGIMALDFIEHLDKQDSLFCLREMSRIAKSRVVIFTPKGFQQNKYLKNENLTELERDLQTHKSGWYPDELEGLGYDIKPMGKSLFAVLYK